MEKQVASLLGLAQRAGKLAAGDDAVLMAMERKKSFLVLIAEDSSDNSRALLSKKAQRYKMNYYFYGTKMEFGMAIGKSPRAAVAILDKNFAAGIEKVLFVGKPGDEK